MIKNRNCDFGPAFQVEIGTSNPSSGLSEGMIFYRSDTNKLMSYDGSSWAAVEGAGGGSTTWIGLTDTAGSITAKSVVRSNAAGDALEFVAVTDAQILVGNGSDIPTAVDITGDVALANDGGTTVTDLTISSEAAGDVLYFDGTNWKRLAKDTGKFLKSGAAAVSWDSVSVAVADKLSDTFEIEGGATYDITVDITTQTTGAPTVTLPDLGGVAQEWVFSAKAQTLTNKTLTSPIVATTDGIVDGGGDAYLKFVEAGTPKSYVQITSGNTGVAPEIASAGETNLDLALVAAGSGVVKADGVEVVTLTGSQALSNKTLTTPIVATTGSINDAGGDEYLKFVESGTPVNFVQITSGDTGTPGEVEVASEGDDTNVNLLLVAKGSGLVKADGVEVATISGTQELTNKTLTSPNVNEAVALTSTATELNTLDGVNAGLTAAELNLLDGAVGGTAVADKALVLGSSKNVDIIVIADGGLKLGAGAGTAITSTAAELNILDGVSADKDEINVLDGVTAGTVTASKAVVVDSDKRIDTIVVAKDGLKIGTGAGTAITTTAAELNVLDAVSAGTVSASSAVVVDANKRIDTIVVADGGLYLGSGAGTAIAATAAELNLTDGIDTAGSLMCFQDATIGHADAAAALMTLPANSKIHFIEFLVTTAWTGGTTSYNLGLGADADALTDGTVLSAIGKTSGAPPTSTVAKWDDTGADTAVTGTDVDSAAGAGKVRIYYT